MNDCLFCKIVNGEIPSEFIFENDDCVAFKDIHPKASTHILIVPKKHISSIADVSYEDAPLLGKLLNYAREIAEKLSLSGYRLSINVGKDGGQEIFHLHIHLMSNS